jgi:hypothetical protein
MKCAGQNNFKTNHFKNKLFWDIFGIFTTNSDVLFIAVHPPPDDSGKHVFGDGLDDPL